VPDFLDTFALIGTLIGETSRLRFLTNVANGGVRSHYRARVPGKHCRPPGGNVP
jgi:alkanesulfonate monooxygenase SsuD/methylene tetrahydromethanopterin reductase-like flavin-dependent oxidoreductase (luciferase family)